jgi:hypothetical protein
MALSAAKSSMLVIVAASSRNPVPPAMQRWLRVWGQSREDQLSAVVLLAAGATLNHPMLHCLQRVARQKGVKFLSEFYEAAPGNQGISNYRARREEIVPPVSIPRLSWQSNRTGTSGRLTPSTLSPTKPSRYEEAALSPGVDSSAS